MPQTNAVPAQYPEAQELINLLREEISRSVDLTNVACAISYSIKNFPMTDGQEKGDTLAPSGFVEILRDEIKRLANNNSKLLAAINNMKIVFS